MAESIANVGTNSDGSPDFSKALILAEKPAGDSGDGHSATAPIVIDAETLSDLHLLHERDQATVAGIAELDGQENVEFDASVKEPTRQVEGVLTGNGDGQWLSGALKLLKESGKTESDNNSSSQAAVARISQKFFEKVFPEVRASDKIDYAEFSDFLYDLDDEDNVVSLSPEEIQRRMIEDPETARLQITENIEQATDYLSAALTRVQEGRPADGNDSVEEIAKAVEGIVRAQKALESLGKIAVDNADMDAARVVINGKSYEPLPSVSGKKTVETKSHNPFEIPASRAEAKPYEVSDVLLEIKYRLKEAGTKRERWLLESDQSRAKIQVGKLDAELAQLNGALTIIEDVTGSENPDLSQLAQILTEAFGEINLQDTATDEESKEKTRRANIYSKALSIVEPAIQKTRDQMPKPIQEWYFAGQK